MRDEPIQTLDTMAHRKKDKRAYPELDAIELAQTLAAAHRSDGTHFVFDELALGLGICQALQRNEPAEAQARLWKIARAQISIEVAEDSMWQLHMSHPDFNQMMALTERLRFEVEDLWKAT